MLLGGPTVSPGHRQSVSEGNAVPVPRSLLEESVQGVRAPSLCLKPPCARSPVLTTLQPLENLRRVWSLSRQLHTHTHTHTHTHSRAHTHHTLSHTYNSDIHSLCLLFQVFRDSLKGKHGSPRSSTPQTSQAPACSSSPFNTELVP